MRPLHASSVTFGLSEDKAAGLAGPLKVERDTDGLSCVRRGQVSNGSNMGRQQRPQRGDTLLALARAPQPREHLAD